MARILVIEDDAFVRSSVKDALEIAEHKVFTADNGAAGIEISIKTDIDLVISDIMMPVMDGYEVLKAFQNNPRTALIPFIFLTAKTSHKDVRAGMSLGAEDYILKPFKVKDLLKSVETRLKKSGRFSKIVETLTSSISLHVPHELRTPLVSILGFTEILIEDLDNLEKKEIIEWLRNIKNSGLKLHRIIERFLIYSGLSVQRARLDGDGSCEISEYFIKAAASNLFSRYGRETDLEIAAEEAELKIPEHYVKIILEEIGENALKFSGDHSTININGVQTEGGYKLSVTDKGRGISKHDLALMLPLVQHYKEKEGHSGNGLGLAIVQKILEIYGGRMSIESEEGRYTTVTVEIPVV